MLEEAIRNGTLKRSPTVLFRKDRHLSSALLTGEIQYMFANRENPAGLKEEHRLLLEHLEKHQLTPLHPRYAYSWFMDNTHLLYKHNHNPELQQLLNIAQQVTEISILNQTHVVAHCLTHSPAFLIDIFNIKVEFDNLFDNIIFSRDFTKVWSLGKLTGIAFGNLHLIHISKKEAFIITHAHLAGLRDMFNSWFDVLLYSSHNENKYSGFNLYDEVIQLIRLFTQFSKDQNGHMATILKAWPSLVISVILKDLENDPTFYNSLVGSIQSVHHPLVAHLTRPILSTSQVHMSLELSGLWKCFGHPIRDMEGSVRSWLEKGSSLKLGLTQSGTEINNMFKYTFCKNYYKEKRTWSPLRNINCTSSRVLHNWCHNVWEEDPRFPWLSQEFHGLWLEPCLSFNMHIDITDLLSDKSIIPSRPQWVHEFDRQAHRSLYQRFPTGPPSTSKSAVISFLEQEEVSVERIIRQIETKVIPEDWKVIVCVAKEREQKESNARFFAKMTPEMRLYQTAMEGNLAEQVLPYIPQQSMTMSEETLTRVIQRMTSPRLTESGQVYRYIVVDFSAWCTNFRHEVVMELFQSFDSLFGLDGVYTFTHLFPLMCIMLFQDRFSPPQQRPDGDPEEGPRCIYGPEAWHEGLRQKGWTILTIMLINLVAERCGTSASLLGQGDNQVILLRLPNPRKLYELQHTEDTYVNWYVHELEIMAERSGLVIKGDETWRSKALFEYSREYHYLGAQVSVALKRISRLASEANQSLPSLSGDLSSLYSTGSATAAKDHQPITAFLCTTVEAAYLIRRKYSWLSQSPLKETTSCLLVTRLLGGLPIGLYSSFCTRAVQDQLTANLRLIKTALVHTSWSRFIARWMSLRFGDKDWEALIKDPQCLPIHAPLQPESIVRREVKTGIETIVQNKMIAAMNCCSHDSGLKAVVGWNCFLTFR